jgi:hypothetical protein
MQHIVETNDAVGMKKRVDEFQVVGQASARVMAVDMNEPHGSLAKLVLQVARRDFATVHLPAKEAVTRDSVGPPPLRTALDWGMVSSETASVRVPIPRDYWDEHSMLNSWIAIIGAVVVAIQRIDDYFKQQDINGFGK